MESQEETNIGRVTRSLRKRLLSVDSEPTSRPGTPTNVKLPSIAEATGSPLRPVRATRRNSVTTPINPKTPARSATPEVSGGSVMSNTGRRSLRRDVELTVTPRTPINVIKKSQCDVLPEEETVDETTEELSTISVRVTRSTSKSPRDSGDGKTPTNTPPSRHCGRTTRASNNLMNKEMEDKSVEQTNNNGNVSIYEEKAMELSPEKGKQKIDVEKNDTQNEEKETEKNIEDELEKENKSESPQGDEDVSQDPNTPVTEPQGIEMINLITPAKAVGFKYSAEAEDESKLSYPKTPANPSKSRSYISTISPKREKLSLNESAGEKTVHINIDDDGDNDEMNSTHMMDTPYEQKLSKNLESSTRMPRVQVVLERLSDRVLNASREKEPIVCHDSECESVEERVDNVKKSDAEKSIAADAVVPQANANADSDTDVEVNENKSLPKEETVGPGEPIYEENDRQFAKSWTQNIVKVGGDMIDSIVTLDEKVQQVEEQKAESPRFLKIKKRRSLAEVSVDEDDEDDEGGEFAEVEFEEEKSIKNPFLANEAEDAGDDYETGDSMDTEEREFGENEIEIEGVSIGSEDTEDGDYVCGEEEDDRQSEDIASFIVDDSADEILLEYSDDDEHMESNIKEKRIYKRIREISSDEDGEKSPQEDQQLGDKMEPAEDDDLQLSLEGLELNQSPAEGEVNEQEAEISRKKSLMVLNRSECFNKTIFEIDPDKDETLTDTTGNTDTTANTDTAATTMAMASFKYRPSHKWRLSLLSRSIDSVSQQEANAKAATSSPKKSTRSRSLLLVATTPVGDESSSHDVFKNDQNEKESINPLEPEECEESLGQPYRRSVRLSSAFAVESEASKLKSDKRSSNFWKRFNDTGNDMEISSIELGNDRPDPSPNDDFNGDRGEGELMDSPVTDSTPTAAEPIVEEPMAPLDTNDRTDHKAEEDHQADNDDIPKSSMENSSVGYETKIKEMKVKRKRMSESFREAVVQNEEAEQVSHKHKKSKISENHDDIETVAEKEKYENAEGGKGGEGEGGVGEKKKKPVEIGHILEYCNRVLESNQQAQLEEKTKAKQVKKMKLLKKKAKRQEETEETDARDQQLGTVRTVEMKKSKKEKEKLKKAVEKALKASEFIKQNRQHAALEKIEEQRESKRLPVDFLKVIAATEEKKKKASPRAEISAEQKSIKDVATGGKKKILLRSAAGMVVETKATGQKKESVAFKTTTGLVTIQPLTPQRSTVSAKGFRESPITPRTIDSRVRQIMSVAYGESTAPVTGTIVGMKKRKRKLNIVEPVYPLPKLQWSTSGMFLEEPLTMREIGKAGNTQFLAASLGGNGPAGKRSRKFELDFKENNQQFQQQPPKDLRSALYYRDDIHRVPSSQLLLKKQRQRVLEKF